MNTIKNNHFYSPADKCGNISDVPFAPDDSNQFNVRAVPGAKVPIYKKPTITDIGDTLRFMWKDSNTGAYMLDNLLHSFMVIVTISDNEVLDGSIDLIFCKPSTKKNWKKFELDLFPSTIKRELRIRIFNNNPTYSKHYGFRLVIAHIQYRNVFTDFADGTLQGWKVRYSAPGIGFGIKHHDTYGLYPYSAEFEFGMGKDFQVGDWVEMYREI